MFPDNHPIFYNHSQILQINCLKEEPTGLELVNKIINKVNNYPCTSNSWHGGLTYFINDCHFSFNDFKPIMDSIANRFLSCKDHILGVLRAPSS